MRVLLTGATGFVGSHVARSLVRRGHEVHALVLEGDAEREKLRERLGDDAAAVHQIHGDLCAPSTWMGALEATKPEGCLHLGWYANPKAYLSSRRNIDLLNASTALFTRLVDLGCRRIVGVGTCFEYDTSLGLLAESSALLPRHLYSACKRALFEVTTQLVSSTQTSFAWARLFYLYGPHESVGRLVPAVTDALLTGETARVTTGEQIRDFLHVADAAEALVHVLESDLRGPVNVASGRPVTVRDIIATIARILGAEDRVAWGAALARPNDPSFICANVEKLRSTGFRPRFDLESGLESTIAWEKARRTPAG